MEIIIIYVWISHTHFLQCNSLPSKWEREKCDQTPLYIQTSPSIVSALLMMMMVMLEGKNILLLHWEVLKIIITKFSRAIKYLRDCTLHLFSSMTGFDCCVRAYICEVRKKRKVSDIAGWWNRQITFWSLRCDINTKFRKTPFNTMTVHAWKPRKSLRGLVEN